MAGITNDPVAVTSRFTRTAAFNSRTATGFAASATTRTVSAGAAGASAVLGGPSVSTIQVTQTILSAKAAKNDPATLAQATSLLSDRDEALTTIQDSLASTTSILQQLQPGSIEGLTDAEVSTLASDLTAAIDVIAQTTGTLKGDVDGFAAGVDLTADDVRALLSSTEDVFGGLAADVQAVRDLMDTVDTSLIGGGPLNGPDYSGQILVAADFSGMDLRGANFAGATIIGGDFSGADLTGANFAGADLDLAKFHNATVTNADFSGADLTSANLQGATGKGAIFTNANANNAKFQNGLFDDANFTDANLTDANFNNTSAQRAELTNADVTGANFSNAVLDEAILVGVDLSQATTNENTSLTGAIYNAEDLPAATDPVADLTASLAAATTSLDSAEAEAADVDATFADLKAQSDAYTATNVATETVTVTRTIAANGGADGSITTFGSLGEAGTRLDQALVRAAYTAPVSGTNDAATANADTTTEAAVATPEILSAVEIGSRVLEQSGMAQAYSLNQTVVDTLTSSLFNKSI